MTDSFVFIPNTGAHGTTPENSIVSSTLQNNEHCKIILFRFAPGQELSAHTAPFPAILYFESGDADVRLGEEERKAGPGTLVSMDARLEHGIRANTETVMLLILLK